MITSASSSPPSVDALLPAASDLLRRLGVTENYKGFQYAAYAIALSAVDRNRLIQVTKQLYPDVAERFATNWSAVERNLRTVIAVAWKQNPSLLVHLSQSPLPGKPPCAQFLSLLSRHLLISDNNFPETCTSHIYVLPV